MARTNKFIDLTGKKFTRLFVLKYIGGSKYLCQCDCGNKVEVYGSNLRRITEGTKSCGCLQQEMYENQKKYNKYDLSGEFGIGYTFKNEPFYFDLEDFDLIKDYCWNIAINDGYVVTNREKGKSLLRMHRLIMGIDDERKIDHQDRKRNNNRRENLRIATNQQNMMNRGLASNNTSGIVGVSWSIDKNKWEVYIRKNKRKFLGRYDNFEDAIIARLKGELEYFGIEFAPQRHLFKQYGII